MSVGAILAGVGAVAGAGASIYSASQAGGSAPAPTTLSPKQSILSYIKGISAGMPQLLSTEGAYRPQFGQLNIADQTQYLNAILGLGGNAASGAAGQLGQARDTEFADMAGNAGAVGNILNLINPQGREAVDRASAMATDAYNRSQALNPQERRMADQTAREAFAARGRVNDNASVASEILQREEVLGAKRQEAAQANATAATMAGQFTNPALSLLSNIPASVSLGQDYLNSSQRIIGQNTPQLINPDAGINLGMANASAINSYNMANAAAQQNQAALWGQVGTSLMGLAGDYFKNN